MVVISRDEGPLLRRTLENYEDTIPANSDIVVVDDGSTDGSADYLARRRRGRVRLLRGQDLGVARARNLGARSTHGGVIVFSDAHITLPPFWWRPLVELVEDPRVGAAAPGVAGMTGRRRPGYGLTFRGPDMDVRWFRRKHKSPVPVPIPPGCCLAMRRDVFEATGGWDEGMLQRGNVDNEGAIRFWMLGYELMVTAETVVGHVFRERSPYPVGWPHFLHNRLRTAFAHFNPVRVGRVVGALRNFPLFGQALLMLAQSNIMAHRREMLARQVHDDNWFFERFGLKW